MNTILRRRHTTKEMVQWQTVFYPASGMAFTAGLLAMSAPKPLCVRSIARSA